jgi:transaldolase
VQRLLWASTGTKNPAYPDTMYVAELVGPDTVNTVPDATLKAVRDHGVVRGATVMEGLADAQARLDGLEAAGISLEEITGEVLEQGVAAFVRSYDQLLDVIAAKRAALAPA